jgi:hypothetical protein
MANERQAPDPQEFRPENEIDLVFSRAKPNPTRAGCPPREVLVALARREISIDDPAWHHLGECSPCYREVRALQQAAGERREGFEQPRRWWLAVAAAVILVSVAGAWYLRSRSQNLAPQSETAPVSSAAELTANVDLRKYTVLRSQEKPTELAPVSILRGRLRLTIQLQPGFEPGQYEIQVLDTDLHSRASATGAGKIRDNVTTVETALDVSGLTPGSYQLAIRRRGEDWRLFPAVLR